jgi:TP901 family phage tail tape measure protein
VSGKKTIGSLLVNIGVDLSDFEKKMNDVNRQFGKLGNQVQDAGAQIGAAFGGVSLAIAGGLGFAVKKAADFEQGMSNIKAVSGATGEEMEKLKELALQMGADTKYSATEAAQGIEELVKAGVSMTDITNGGLKGALSLATAGGLELAEAAEIASTALNAFRKDGLNVSKAADILAGAANASATSVQELKFGLQQVASVSASVGMSFEDTTTALAVLAQNGKKGSDAGTSLKTMLMRLQPSTKEASKVFEELNLATSDGSSIFFDAEGKLKSLNNIAGILKNSMTGLSDAQKLQKMNTIFGSDAIAAANILFNEGASGVDKMKKAMSKVTAEQVAAEKLNNLNGAIEQLKGAFETFMISIGETLVPALKEAAKYLGKIVDWFNELSPATKKIITYIAAATMVLTGLVAIVAFATVGMGFLAAAEWAVILPILGIIAAVVAVIAIFVALGMWLNKLYQQNETFRNAVNSVWSTIKNVIMTVVAIVMPVVLSLWDTLKTGLLQAWAIVQPALMQVWDFIYTIFKQIGAFINENLGAIKIVFGTVFKIITTIVNVALVLIWGIVKGILNGIVTTFRVVLTAVKLVVMSVFTAVRFVVKTALDLIAGIIRTVMAVIKGDWSGAWNTIKETFMKVFNNISSFITGFQSVFLDAGKGFINALIDGIKSGVTNLTDTVKGVAKKIREFLPFSPAKVGPLSDLDKLDFAGPISTAIKGGVPDVQASMNSMLQVPDVNPSVTADMGGGTTVIMQLDSKTIGKATFAQMAGTFRLRGAVT